jgi:hypothetical protein
MSSLAAEPTLSKTALAGLILSLAFYPLLFVGFMLVGPCHPPPGLQGEIGRWIIVSIPICIGASLLLCAWAAIAIPKSQGRKWGLPFAWMGLVHSAILAFIVVSSLR